LQGSNRYLKAERFDVDISIAATPVKKIVFGRFCPGKIGRDTWMFFPNHSISGSKFIY
jgi:hypothetical protein